MQTIENLLLQTCTFTKWKLILSNNEDNNNNIDIINNKINNDNNNNKNNSVTSSVINSWICFTFLNVFSVKCSSMFNFFLSHLLRAYAIHVPVANLSVQSSMFNFFFLAHLLRAYAIHVPVASSIWQFEHRKFDANLWKSSSPNMHIHKVKTYPL